MFRLGILSDAGGAFDLSYFDNYFELIRIGRFLYLNITLIKLNQFPSYVPKCFVLLLIGKVMIEINCNRTQFGH